MAASAEDATPAAQVLPRPVRTPIHRNVISKRCLWPAPAPRRSASYLPLGVLSCLASALEAVLLAFLHPRVAGKEAIAAQLGLERLIEGDEGAGDAVRESSRPAGEAAAFPLRLH